MVDALSGFTPSTFAFDGVSKTVFRMGSGPAVIVMTEIPGITPKVAEFARRVAALGTTVVLPDLFGEAGRERSGTYVAQSVIKGCISKEFNTWATDEASPVTIWLRGLARSLHEECGGPGVGAVGMCFTGGFALAMTVDDAVVAPVLSQPSLPFAFGAERKRALGLSDADLRVVADRVEAGCPVLGLRFSHDSLVPKERFTRLRQALGNGFIAVEINSGPGNPYEIAKSSHSVLTEDLVDAPGHPTREALDQVLAFLSERLGLDATHEA